MRSILLLVDSVEQRAQLTELLATRYTVASDLSTFDLCILDSANYERRILEIKSWREAARPMFLPLLLVLPPDDLKPDYLWNSVDELITLPVHSVELHKRIYGLLRMRQLSLDHKASKEREVRISKALQSISDAINIVDMDGVAIYNNSAFFNLYGYTPYELNLYGIPNTLFRQPQMAIEIFKTVNEGKSWNGEVELVKKNGEVIPTWLRADSIINDSGEQIGLISVYTEITELKQAQEAERQQRLLAEALRDSAAALTSTLDLAEVLERILSSVGSVVPHDTANIMMVDTGGVAYVVRSQGDDGKIETYQHVQVSELISLNWMIETGQPVAVPDTREYPDWIDALYTPELRSYAGAPIHLKGKVIGFINLGSAIAGFYTPAHAERLLAFAEQAAIAIQNAQLHEKAQELAAVEERNRLARDLHDAVSQTLFSASVIAESLPRLWARNPDKTEKVHQRLIQLNRLTRGALAEMRTLLLELRPKALLEAPLDEILCHLVEATMGRTTVPIEFNSPKDINVPPEVQIGLYYITQECLNNIIKHARATEASVKLTKTKDQLRLNIQDNGRGFDINKLSPTSLGLKIMRERAESINAAFQIKSVEKQGTQIGVVWSEKQG